MRLEELRLLSQMLLLTTADASVQAVLERAAQNASRLTSANRASVMIPGPGPDSWRFAAEWDGASTEAVVLGAEVGAGARSGAGDARALARVYIGRRQEHSAHFTLSTAATL